MSTMLRFLFAAALLGIAAFALPAAADSGSLQVQRGDGSHAAVASLDTSVDLAINGLVAEVRVKQRFRNDGDAWQQGEYLLPLPEGAAVHALTLRIGQRLIVGEIREKEAARSEFAAAVASGRKASLVEAHSANLFRTAIANVAPGESVEVEIGYWQQVDFRDGEFSLVFPLTYTPRYTSAQTAAIAEPVAEPVSEPVSEAKAEVVETTAAIAPAAAARAGSPTIVINATLDAGLPLARVESATHALAIRQNGQHYTIALADTVVAADRDFVLRWTPQPSATPTAAPLRSRC